MSSSATDGNLPLASYANTASKVLTPWQLAFAPNVTVGDLLGGAFAPGDSTLHLRVGASVGKIATVCTATVVVRPSLPAHSVNGATSPVAEVQPADNLVKPLAGKMGIPPAQLNDLARLLSVTTHDGDYVSHAARALYAAYVTAVSPPIAVAPAQPPGLFPAAMNMLVDGTHYALDARRFRNSIIPAGVWGAAVSLALPDFGHPAGTVPALGTAWGPGPIPMLVGQTGLAGAVPPPPVPAPPGAADFLTLAEVLCTHEAEPAKAFESAFSFCASLLHVADIRSHAFAGVVRAATPAAHIAVLNYLLHHAPASPGLPAAVAAVAEHIMGPGLPAPVAPAAVPALRPAPPAFPPGGPAPQAVTAEELALLSTDMFWAMVTTPPPHAAVDPFAAVGGAVVWLGPAAGAAWAPPAGGWPARPPAGQLLSGIPSLPVLGVPVSLALPYSSGIALFTSSYLANAAVPAPRRPPIPFDLAATLLPRLALCAAIMRTATDVAVSGLHASPAAEEAAFGQLPFLPPGAQDVAALAMCGGRLASASGTDLLHLGSVFLQDCEPILATTYGAGLVQPSGAVSQLMQWPGSRTAPSGFLMPFAFSPEQHTVFSGSPAASALSRAAPALATPAIFRKAKELNLPTCAAASIVDGALRLAGVVPSWVAVFAGHQEEGLDPQSIDVAIPDLAPRLPDGCGQASWGLCTLLYLVHVPLCGNWARRAHRASEATRGQPFRHYLQGALHRAFALQPLQRLAVAPIPPNPNPALAGTAGGLEAIARSVGATARDAVSAPPLRFLKPTASADTAIYWRYQSGTTEPAARATLSSTAPTDLSNSAPALTGEAIPAQGAGVPEPVAAANFGTLWSAGTARVAPTGSAMRGGRGGM